MCPLIPLCHIFELDVTLLQFECDGLGFFFQLELIFVLVALALKSLRFSEMSSWWLLYYLLYILNLDFLRSSLLGRLILRLIVFRSLNIKSCGLDSGRLNLSRLVQRLNLNEFSLSPCIILYFSSTKAGCFYQLFSSFTLGDKFLILQLN
jgi:hypothetical protein